MSNPEPKDQRRFDRRHFLTAFAVGAGAAPFAVMGRSLFAGAGAPQAPSLCYGNPAVLKESDFSYLGCMKMPSSGTETEFTYGGLTARRVNGQLRFFIFSRNPSGAFGAIASGQSTQTFTLTAGQGAAFKAGQKVVVRRAAGGAAVPDSRKIQSISGDQVTLSSPLASTPVAGDGMYREQDYFVYELADTGTYSTDTVNAPRMSLVTAWPDVFNGRRISWDMQGNLVAPLGYQIPAGLYWHEANQLLYWGYFDSYSGASGRNDYSIGATSLVDPATATSQSYGPWRPKVTDRNGKVWLGPARGASIMAGPDGSMGVFGSAFGALQMPWGPQFYAGAPWPTTSTPSGLGAPDLVFQDRYLEHYYMGNMFAADGSFNGQIRSFRYPAYPFRPYIYEGLDVPVCYADPAKNGGVCSWTTLNRLSGAIWLELQNKRGVIFASNLVGSPNTDVSSVQAAHIWYANAGMGHAKCNHGFGPPAVPDIAGPVATAQFPAFIIYNPDDLYAVKQGTRTDYTVDPTSVIDLQSSFGVKTPPANQLGGKNVQGFYFDSTRNYLFVLSCGADDAVPGYRPALIHVFAVSP